MRPTGLGVDGSAETTLGSTVEMVVVAVEFEVEMEGVVGVVKEGTGTGVGVGGSSGFILDGKYSSVGRGRCCGHTKGEDGVEWEGKKGRGGGGRDRSGYQRLPLTSPRCPSVFQLS